MSRLTLGLLLLVLLLQYPLWFGDGGWLSVWEYDQKLEQIREENQKIKQKNAALEAEVRDLKGGYEAIEESARSELGMIKPGEVFIPFTGEEVAADAPDSRRDTNEETGKRD
ncbi:MAG: cell division protein FtsB [Betaproteobacteria bacterium]|nr:cell division protein FtsB [Betaproteobacteria bacterium]